MSIKLHPSVRGDRFDTQNFENQMKHFMSGVSKNKEISDDILEPDFEEPYQIQINVVEANKIVGDEDQYVMNLENNDKMLWLKERKTRGQLQQPIRDDRTVEFEDEWYPNELDNLQNLPQLAAGFKRRRGVVDVTWKDRFGDIFKENSHEVLNYIDMATSENERVVNKIYETI